MLSADVQERVLWEEGVRERILGEAKAEQHFRGEVRVARGRRERKRTPGEKAAVVSV